MQLPKTLQTAGLWCAECRSQAVYGLQAQQMAGDRQLCWHVQGVGHMQGRPAKRGCHRRPCLWAGLIQQC